MIAKRVKHLWIAVCDNCHAEGIAADRKPGQTRAQRRRAFLNAAGTLDSAVPALDGKWFCGACRGPGAS